MSYKTHQCFNPFELTSLRRIMIGSKSLRNSTAAYNSPTISGIRNRKLAFRYQSGYTTRAAPRAFFQEVLVRFDVTFSYRSLNRVTFFSRSRRLHRRLNVVAEILRRELRRFGSAVTVENAEEHEVALDVRLRVAFEDDAAVVVLDGRVGCDGISVVSPDRVRLSRDGIRDFVLFQARVRLVLA